MLVVTLFIAGAVVLLCGLSLLDLLLTDKALRRYPNTEVPNKQEDKKMTRRFCDVCDEDITAESSEISVRSTPPEVRLNKPLCLRNGFWKEVDICWSCYVKAINAVIPVD